jgi:hypothetical protein
MFIIFSLFEKANFALKMRLIGPTRSVSEPLMPHTDLICLGCFRTSRKPKRKRKRKNPIRKKCECDDTDFSGRDVW